MSHHISLEELNVSLEAIRYQQFFRQRGMFKLGSFQIPRVNNISTFELPLSSIVHYLPQSEVELGPVPTHLFLRKASSHILSDNIIQLADKQGAPMSTAVSLPTLVEAYKKQYRRIRPLRELKTATRDERVVIIENYAMLSRLYKYRITFQTRIFKFNNLMATFIAKANQLAVEAPNHQQYVEVTLPKNMIDKLAFVQGAAGLTKERMRRFPDDKSLFLLELWKWFGVHRETGILSKLSPEALSKMNLVFTEKSRYVVMNLGLIDEWRKNPTIEKDKGLAPQQMQLLFLSFLESLFAIRTVAADNVVVTTTSKTDDDDDDDVKIVQVISEGEAIKEMDELEETAKNSSNDAVEDEAEDDTQEQYIPVQEITDFAEPQMEDEEPEHIEGVHNRVLALAEDGLLSTAEQRRYERLAESYKTIPNPYGDGTLKDLATITDEDLALNEYQIEDIPHVMDKSMLKSSLRDFFGKYLGKGVLQKDIAAAILRAQKAGVIISDYRVERVVDAMNKYDIHIVEFTPVGGAKSTWRFKVPAVDENGIMLSGNIKYRLRVQRGDIPIRKTKPDEVALTSYYGKVFIKRSQKKVDDYGEWLSRSALATIENADNKVVKSVHYGNCFVKELKTPRAFSAMSIKFRSLAVSEFEIIFDQARLKAAMGLDDKDLEKAIAGYMTNGEMLCGKVGDAHLVMANAGHLYNSKTGEVYGNIEELLGLPSDKAPVDAVTVDIMGKDIPMGMVLGYRYGLSNLLRKLKVEHRFVVRGARMQLEPGEYVIRFKDQSLILNREQAAASLIFSSLNAYHKALAEFDYAEFDKPDVYGAVFLKMGLNVQYSNEITHMFDLYIDHITEGYLARMGEPTRFGPLLLRSVELLTNDSHPRAVKGSLLRLRGYERIAGRVYKTMVGGIRQYKRKPLSSKAKIEINPYDVWNAVMGDSAISIPEEANPLHNSKEPRNVTYAGTDGRSSRTMVRSARESDEEDVGTISEATVDNGDVAVTVFMSGNPQIDSLRGGMKDVDRSPQNLRKNAAMLLSTTSLISPCITQDDPKRANFANIQHSQVIQADGYEVCPLQTGYETALAHEVTDLFAATAKGKGKVVEVSEKHLVIEYDDENLKRLTVELGRRYGVAAGSTRAHDLVTDLKVGDKVSKDHVVAWNTGFFVRSFLAPTQVLWKAGVLATVAFLESPGTFEDSCEMSESLNQKMTTTDTEVRALTFKSDQTIHKLVRVGDEVEADTILCNIEDPVTAGSGNFNEQSIATLSVVARNSPRAKVDGTINAMEVYYNVDLEGDEVSDSIRKIIMQGDKDWQQRAKLLKDGSATNGLVTEDLEPGTVLVNIKIDSKLGAGDGDKFVFGHQMKSVSRRQMYGENRTEDGRDIDAFFSYTSTDNRQVLSIMLMATTIPLIELANSRAVNAYRS